MKLFASVYLDEDVSVLVCELLQARGFVATTALNEDMLGKDDSTQITHAISLQRCIVTHNRVHFEKLQHYYVTTGRYHHGIIVASRRSPFEIARRLAALLNMLTIDEIANQLLYV